MLRYISVNWYQRNYPYAWIGARIVRDQPVGANGGAGLN